MAKQSVSNSQGGQGFFKGTGNLLQDLLSSSVSLKKLKLSSLLNHKTCSTVLESEDENKGLTLFTSSCSVCFSDSERVEPIKETEVDILKEVVWRNDVTPPPPGFNWICTHCSATLGRLARCRQEIEDIVTCLLSVMRIQTAISGQRSSLMHSSKGGAVKDVSSLSSQMPTTERVSLSQNEATTSKPVPVTPSSNYNAQEFVGLDYVPGNILKGDTDNRDGINSSHVVEEDGNECEDKFIHVPVETEDAAELGEDPLDLTNLQVIEQALLLATLPLGNQEGPANADNDKPKTKQTTLPCTGTNARNKRKTRKQHPCHIPGCGKVYSSPRYLLNHLEQHSPEKPFMCKWQSCDGWFTTSDELQIHMKTHTVENPFVCPWPHCGVKRRTLCVKRRTLRGYGG